MPHYAPLLLQVDDPVLLDLACLVILDGCFQCAHVLIEVADAELSLIDVRVPKHLVDYGLRSSYLLLVILLFVGQLRKEQHIPC